MNLSLRLTKVSPSTILDKAYLSQLWLRGIWSRERKSSRPAWPGRLQVAWSHCSLRLLLLASGAPRTAPLKIAGTGAPR